MRLHMDWSAGLSLCFLFADSPSAVAPIREWADDAWQWRTAPLLLIEPTDASLAAEAVLAALEQQRARLPGTRAPVWVQLLARDEQGSSAWDAARARCLARLNEGREWLVREFARPLVLCLPTPWLARTGHTAPDLWHVRSFTAVVAAPAGVPGTGTAAPRTMADTSAELLAEPERQLFDARARCAASNSANNRRELSIALGDFGDACATAGRGEAALAAYRESLALRRQLRQVLGDGPQVLRDLSVSLSNVGEAEAAAGRGEAALAAYRESLALRRQLREVLGDGPQVLRDLSISLSKVGEAEAAAGCGEAALAAYRESLALRRQLREALGDGPQVLDDLAVSLERLAGHAENAAERRAASAEAVVLRERLVAPCPIQLGTTAALK